MSVLKLIYEQKETYNFKIHYFSGVKSFWLVQNNQPIIDSIKKLNSSYKAFSITTYEFSTPYTNIPHYKFKNMLRKLINFCFREGENSLLL